MNGYVLTTTANTKGWVVYENDISIDYKEFFKGELLPSEELPLFYNIPKRSNLKKIKSAVLLESAGPELVCKRLRDVLESLTGDIQFFDVDLFGLMVKCTPERGDNALFFIPLQVFIML